MDEFNPNIPITDKPTDADSDMLNSIRKNAEMGKKSIETVVKKLSDGDFKTILLEHYQDFDDISSCITTALTEKGETPKTQNILTSTMLSGSISMKTLMDDSNSHIADMMIQGSNMGITTINKELNAHKAEVSENTAKLAVKLLSIEQKHIDKLKTFL